MIINIVDYKDDRIPVYIGDIENIDYIEVEVLTGDEVITVWYKDGTYKDDLDGSQCHLKDYYDGEYDVPSEQIEKWSNMPGSSYDRMERFIESVEEWNMNYY